MHIVHSPVSGLCGMEMFTKMPKFNSSGAQAPDLPLPYGFHFLPQKSCKGVFPKTDRKYQGPWLGTVEIHRKGQI